MGHLHDKFLKQYDHLKGPLAYPGSTEMTTSEGIKETEKGFFKVDISENNAKPEWIKLDTRPQISVKTEFENIDSVIKELDEKISKLEKKPIIEIKIHGENLEREAIEGKNSRISLKIITLFMENLSK